MPDPLAQQTNKNNLKVYASAHEQGILRGIVIDPEKQACEAVRAYKEVYDFWTRPTLPVPGCDNAADCACTYRALFNEDIRVLKR